MRLQQTMNRQHKMTATRTLEITQQLREKYKAITYNRSDCSCLSGEQFNEAPQVLYALKGIGDFSGLALAKEKFGSSLTIKGSKAFKAQLVDVVAKNNLDIHFTDKVMNQQLEARKAELDIEKTGQRIEQPNNAVDPEKTAEINQKTEAREPEQKTQTSSTTKHDVFEGCLIEHGPSPFKFKPDSSKTEEKRNDSYFVKLQLDDGNIKTLWGVGLEDAVAGLETNEQIRLEDKGVVPVKRTETQADGKSVNKSGQRRIWQVTPIACL